MPQTSQHTPRANSGQNNYPGYEAAKYAWRRSHPDATPETYAAAMRALADELGV